jgi:hypothetical protein
MVEVALDDISVLDPMPGAFGDFGNTAPRISLGG